MAALILLFLHPFVLPGQWSSPEASAARVSVLVLDVSGAAVPGASVLVLSGGRVVAEGSTPASGRFAAAGLPAGRAVLRVSAPGFSEVVEPIDIAPDGEPRIVRVVLSPAPVADVVLVTASRGHPTALESPASASILTAAALLSGGPATLDDALRAVPGFSLFRRSSSRVANPTTQGATLRGLAGSGASRALALADGLPLNDPFGGWIYWNRIPLTAIERVEVMRGGSSELYGADALGGVIQVLTFPAGRGGLRAAFEHGSHDTTRGSLFAAGQMGRWHALGSGEWSASTGFPIVAPESRGPVDVPAGVDYRSLLAGAGVDAGAWRAQARVNLFGEDRRNGTPLQVNDTRLGQIAADASGFAAGGAWAARSFHSRQEYHQTFSAIAPGRATEQLTRAQDVPVDSTGGGLEWVRPWRGQHLLIGAEARVVDARNEETAFVAGQPMAVPPDGGRQQTVALFSQGTLQPADALTVVAGARTERWRTGRLDEVSRHTATFFAPRASVSWRMSPSLSLRGAAHAAYRPPTLNELYRSFRVGNVVTSSNPALDRERATGVEGGLLVTRPGVSARIVGFWTHLSDAIANVTLSTSPALIQRQRQNAGSIRAAGVEIEGDYRPHRLVSLTGMAALGRSAFHRAAEPGLEGNRVPQAPLYQLAGGVRYADARLTVSAQVRVAGSQFEDDRNELSLGRAATIDLFASRSLARGVHAFAAAENVLDAEYDVGRTPVRTIGLPRTLRAGLRMFLP